MGRTRYGITLNYCITFQVLFRALAYNDESQLGQKRASQRNNGKNKTTMEHPRHLLGFLSLSGMSKAMRPQVLPCPPSPSEAGITAPTFTTTALT